MNNSKRDTSYFCDWLGFESMFSKLLLAGLIGTALAAPNKPANDDKYYLTHSLNDYKHHHLENTRRWPLRPQPAVTQTMGGSMDLTAPTNATWSSGKVSALIWNSLSMSSNTYERLETSCSGTQRLPTVAWAQEEAGATSAALTTGTATPSATMWTAAMTTPAPGAATTDTSTGEKTGLTKIYWVRQRPWIGTRPRSVVSTTTASSPSPPARQSTTSSWPGSRPVSVQFLTDDTTLKTNSISVDGNYTSSYWLGGVDYFGEMI